MIKHIVMFKLKGEADGRSAFENAKKARELLAGFEKEIPSLKKIEVGINSPDAPESNFELVLVCDFDDIRGLDEYQTHPKHLEFGKFIVGVRESRACIDYEY